MRERRELGIVGAEHGYALTSLGVELLAALKPVDAWAQRWERALSVRR